MEVRPVAATRPVPFERADVLTSKPRSPTHRVLVGAAELARMRPARCSSHGPRHARRHRALTAAVRDGHCARALDVTDPEPLRPTPRARRCQARCCAHIGSATHAARERMAELAVENSGGSRARPATLRA
jgi:glyoxylate reductase